jgi:[acyl-carrier-protein] S-malonyltransferase
MQPAADRLAAVLASLTIHPLTVPVVTNVEASANSDQHRVRELLVSQVCSPVLWEQSVLAMSELGVTRSIEIGPGKVLSGLVKRITKDIDVFNVEEPAGLAALAPLA